MTATMRIFLSVLCVAALVSVSECRGLIYTLLRDNVAGAPVTHDKQLWNFDPDVALRRRVEYQRINGYRGRDLVERVGLGEDGRQDERRLQQIARDSAGVPPEVDWHP